MTRDQLIALIERPGEECQVADTFRKEFIRLLRETHLSADDAETVRDAVRALRMLVYHYADLTKRLAEILPPALPRVEWIDRGVYSTASYTDAAGVEWSLLVMPCDVACTRWDSYVTRPGVNELGGDDCTSMEAAKADAVKLLGELVRGGK